MNDPASRPALAPEAFRRARAIFELALDWPPGERERLIRDECREDEGLASMVQAMLRADATRHTLLDGSPAVHADRWQPGDTFADRYRIVALLGRGGMGEVYRAQRRLLGLFSFAAAVFLTLPSHRARLHRHRLLQVSLSNLQAATVRRALTRSRVQNLDSSAGHRPRVDALWGIHRRVGRLTAVGAGESAAPRPRRPAPGTGDERQ